MKKLFLFFLSVSLLGMEVKSTAGPKFEYFENLPIELRAKIVMHLCDEISARYYWGVLPRVIPILKTCKKYYLNDIVFTRELLRQIHELDNNKILGRPELGYPELYFGLCIPTPACKRAFNKMSNKEQENQLAEFTRIPLRPKQLCMLSDIRNNRIRFKESLQITQHTNHQLNTN